jgi:uncharacterized membrane protein YeaQ/YmgE (transglycosylase-associated protein family)
LLNSTPTMILQSVLVWILTGLVAGWVARLAMRSQRGYGLIGDLATGCLGAVLGGWLLRQLDVWAPPNVLGHALVALVGAATLLTALRLARNLGAAVGLRTPSAIAATASNLDGLMR